MKKRIVTALLAAALTLSLCACAGTNESGANSLVSNPFETSENENSEYIGNGKLFRQYKRNDRIGEILF